MKIYVQSRGFAQDYDYCWQSEAPPIIRNNRLNDLIQSESPSLVLARYEDELVLLITGMEARERVDFRGRIIRNSVAWVDKDTEENEQKLRSIAVKALRDLLKADIDRAVQFGGEYGFEVNFNAINQLNKIADVRNFPAKLDSKIGKNSQDLRDELAYELEERCLPQGSSFSNTPLVVVTGIKSASNLMQAGVWRGLSNLVQAEGWKDPYKKSAAFEQAVETQEQKNNTVIFIIGFIVAIAIAGIIFLLLQQLPSSQGSNALRPNGLIDCPNG